MSSGEPGAGSTYQATAKWQDALPQAPRPAVTSTIYALQLLLFQLLNNTDNMKTNVRIAKKYAGAAEYKSITIIHRVLEK